jgi:histidinol-phosphate/aromatic aminotransferase/cobyric acid decarboxylase-like protein
LSKVIAPYPVPAPVADIASNALEKEGLTRMSNRVKETNLLCQALSNWLNQQDWCQQVFPTDANFVLFRTDKKDFIFNALAKQGILIRDQSKQLQLANCLRISIGSERELSLLKKSITLALSTETEQPLNSEEN